MTAPDETCHRTIGDGARDLHRALTYFDEDCDIGLPTNTVPTAALRSPDFYFHVSPKATKAARQRDLFAEAVDRLCFVVVGASIVGTVWFASSAGWL